MKRSRFNEEQIIAILREQEAGAKTVEVCRKHGISDATFYKWKASRLDSSWGLFFIVVFDSTLLLSSGINGSI